MLFELDEHYPSMRLFDVEDDTDEDDLEKRIAVCFRYKLVESFLKEWKLNWPQTADDCGKFQPKKEWREKTQVHKKPSETCRFGGLHSLSLFLENEAK